MEQFPSQVAELENRARRQFAQGALREALADYQRLCELTPRDPGAWHMLGVVHGSLGNLEEAARCARETVALAPAAAAGYRNLGHFQLQLGHAADAESSLRTALSLSGGDARDHANLGAALAALGRHPDAIACYERALALSPDDAGTHFNLAAALHALERWPEAARHYERASVLVPTERRYLAGLAVAERAGGRDDQALAAWQRVLRLVPDDLEALRNVGAICYAHGRLDAAAQAYAQIVEVTDAAADALIDLGLTLLELGSVERALDCFSRILVQEPGHPEATYNRALALERLGRLDEALATYGQVAEDRGLDVIGAQAGVLERMGKFDAAHALLAPLVGSATAGVRALDAYARLCRHFDACDRALAWIEDRLRAGDVGGEGPRALHFRAGELYDRQHRYDEAFAHFQAGNSLRRYRYNVADDARYIDRLIEAMAPEAYARLPAATGAGEVTPIFIVGMPRSGTTLTEQILASHPAVRAGDELPFMPRILGAARQCAGGVLHYPDYLPYLTAADCEAMAHAYLAEVRARFPGAAYVTDKMPHNFQYAALIHRLFPGAPIIHCLRDPADVCLSCYFQDFATRHNYAYDLTHLGQHYRQYARCMAHYTNVLHIPMFEARYEAMVDDPETASRALVEHCGLVWDERCLRFYESDRKAKTASYDQVRQPIYKRSRQRWRNYEAHLAPLFRALDGEPPAAGQGGA